MTDIEKAIYNLTELKELLEAVLLAKNFEGMGSAIQALQEKAEREKLQDNCACMTNIKACCTCVSMRCHYCVKQSNYTKVSFFSTCGRKLNNATTDNI